MDAEHSPRREFLNRGTRIALVTPAAMAALLHAEGRGYAAARSGGGSGGSVGLGNPGNGKPVGRAGEEPPGNPNNGSNNGVTGASGGNNGGGNGNGRRNRG